MSSNDQQIDMSGEAPGQWSTKWMMRNETRVMIHTTTAPGEYPVIYSAEGFGYPQIASLQGKYDVNDSADCIYDLIPIPPPKVKHYITVWLKTNKEFAASNPEKVLSDAMSYGEALIGLTHIKTIEVEL